MEDGLGGRQLVVKKRREQAVSGGIDYVEVRDFQRHRNTRVHFDPAITTIVGPSDSGKSAIIRALRWALLNEGVGAGFVRSGAKSASVIVSVGGRKITRAQSSSDNVYELDGRAFRGFGRDVPAPVAEAARIKPINFQGQHDLPFWLSETAGEVSRQLNQLVDLELIDQTLSRLAAEIRKVQSDISHYEPELASLKERRREYRVLPLLRAELATVQNLQQKVGQVAAEVEGLREVKESAEHALAAAARAEALGREAERTRAALERYERLSEDVGVLRDGLECIRALAAARRCETRRLRSSLERCEQLESEKAELVERIERAERLADEERENGERVKELEQELQKLAEGRCVLCGAKLRAGRKW